jgi:hypothetical protein
VKELVRKPIESSARYVVVAGCIQADRPNS